MKRFSLILTLLVIGVFGARAQGRHELQVSMGGPVGGFQYVDTGTEHRGMDLAGLYEPYEMMDPGATLSVDYNYALKGWLKPGVGLNWGMLWGYREAALAAGDSGRDPFCRNFFTLLPQVSLFAVDRTHLKLYGKLAAGGTLSIGTDDGVHLSPAWEIVPLGFQWGGQKLFGLAELAYGNVYFVRIGLGFRW